MCQMRKGQRKVTCRVSVGKADVDKRAQVPDCSNWYAGDAQRPVPVKSKQ